MSASVTHPHDVDLAPGVRVLLGDVLARLADVADESVQAIVTSPPYLDARDYNVPPTAWPEVTYRPRLDLPEVTVPAVTCCLGHEPTLLAYVGHIVVIARELRRVLRRDGTLWLNLAAGYSSGTTAPRRPTTTEGDHVPASWKGRCYEARVTAGYPAKQLIPAQWAVFEALQGDGWYWRNTLPWVKPNAKPDSAADRFTPSWEPVALFTRAPQYFFDAHAISTPAKGPSRNRARKYGEGRADPGDHHGASVPWAGDLAHPRDVWTIPVGRFKGAHFATFPQELARRCVLAGTSEAGCCPACGAPWRKILARVGNPARNWRDADTPSELTGAHGRRRSKGHAPDLGQNTVPRAHVGWEMACRCPLAPPVPCVVLDPFAGSGTTLAEAHVLERGAVGIDAQAAYLEHMHERMADAEARRAARALDATTPLRPRRAGPAEETDGPLFTARTHGAAR